VVYHVNTKKRLKHTQTICITIASCNVQFFKNTEERLLLVIET